MMDKPVLAIIIPCYNEEAALSHTLDRLIEVGRDLKNRGIIDEKSFLFLVDDGSTDSTWNIIEKYNNSNHEVKALKFTRNFGNQNALLAGLTRVAEIGVDCALTIDADLQQDETKIEEFIQKYREGAHIVCGVRTNRHTDSLMKKSTALMFYQFMNMLGVKIKKNHSDYRLVSKKALDILRKYKEVNLFLRGFFYELGLKTEYVYFEVKERELGESKYTFSSLYRLAIDAITSYSFVPLRVVYGLGFFITVVSFILCALALFEDIFDIYEFSSHVILVFVLCFFGGLQILAIGIIGEYVAHLFQEVKGRPRYIEDKELL